MPLDEMVEKAWRLIKSGRVERLNHERFIVVGDHGTYTVTLTGSGKISCNCPGFTSRGRCSHSAAVIVLTEFQQKPRKARE